MLEKPALNENVISAGINHAYGLDASQVVFLPLGYDLSTAVYRVDTGDGQSYFLKLRYGKFAPVTVLLPKFLSSQGIKTIIAPLETRTGTVFDQISGYTAILYQYISGKDGYQVRLSASNWVSLGQILQQVHGANLPPTLAQMVPRESFDPHWRESTKRFLKKIETQVYTDHIARQLSMFLMAKREVILHMVQRASSLAARLQHQPVEFVLCHSDAHPGNYLVSETGELYLVDWDNPTYAPKERDLMCFGSGMSGYQPGGWEERLFYRGYGVCEINQTALAYYRYERIIQDIAEFCKQVLLGASRGEDRAQSYTYLTSSFMPGAEVEVALQSDMTAAD
jgi:spectinomycin phosphotransferase